MRAKGSILGGALLVAGSCIGAGMLGLPIITGIAGFVPSLSMFVCAWIFMITTGLLIVEINGWFARKANFITMVEALLGKTGRACCWIGYLFLFYALLVAYISGSGSLCVTLFDLGFGVPLPQWLLSCLFVLLFGTIVFAGTRHVDFWNRILMILKISFFAGLVLIGTSYIDLSLLAYSKPSLALFSLPILIISFGFHNVIPVLTDYLEKDLKKVRVAIVSGSLFAFGIYIIWEILVLGTVPVAGNFGLISALLNDQEGSQALSMFLQSPWVLLFAQGLAFFAILTSFLTQALSLVHFLEDGLKLNYKKHENLLVCLAVLIPPLILALLCPRLFFSALNFAGGICAVILFGILPVVMAWKGRYRKAYTGSYKFFGGKGVLIGILAFSLMVLSFQLLKTFHIIDLMELIHA